MKYQTQEFRILFEPIDTPERERAKKEALSLLENLSNTELKDDFVLTGKIKVEPFCVVCKIKVHEKHIDETLENFEGADMSLLCSFISEHIQYAWLCFDASSFGDIYARTYLKSKVKNIGNRLGYRSHHAILAYKPFIDEFFGLIHRPRYATESSEEENVSDIVDTFEIPEGIERIIYYNNGNVDVGNICCRPKKIILSSTVKTIYYWGKWIVSNLVRNFVSEKSHKSIMLR